MRITSKGQVTIPQDIRTRFGLLPHTEVEFVIEDDHIIVQKAKSSYDGSRSQTLAQQMLGKSTVHMTTDEIMQLTRGDKV